jgi:hypothetical protein
MRRTWIVATVVALSAVIAATIVLSRPGGLPSQPASSVPALLSEPAGVPGAGLVLAPDGLGPVTFGDDAETVVSHLTELLGAPVEDGPQPCESEAEQVRWVRWGNLSAAFADGRFSGYVIGIYYRADSPELRVETAEGIALGATTDELVAAYGDRLSWNSLEESGFEDPVDGFGIDGWDVDDPLPIGIGGFVEGGIEDGRVITFNGGQPCGPP